MKRLILAGLLVISFNASAEVRLYGDDGQYLGKVGGRYESDSINNPYGQYGSRYSSTSINNPYSQYGRSSNSRNSDDQYGHHDEGRPAISLGLHAPSVWDD